MRDYYNGFLHAHKFGAKKYDCVWITWVLMYLSDSEIFTLFTLLEFGPPCAWTPPVRDFVN